MRTGIALSLGLWLWSPLATAVVLPFMDFKINATRFEDDQCTDGRKIGGWHDRIVAEDGECASWDDGAEFQGLRYKWAAYGPNFEEPSDYGDCIMHFWRDEGCFGEPHCKALGINDEDNFGRCAQPCGGARSLKVVCKGRGWF